MSRSRRERAVRPCERCGFVREARPGTPNCRPCVAVEVFEEKNKMSMILAPGAIPATVLREPRPHVCGKCRNPYTNGNPNCPNARGVK